MEMQKPILARKRGRPRKDYCRKDTGTPELVMKRLLGETSEALDLCLERDIITPQQHWCGIHLRWLYTLRYGSPGVRAVDTTHLGGIVIRREDSGWRRDREEEYLQAVKKLAQKGLASLLINLCVHNERPLRRQALTVKNADETSLCIEHLREGFDLLGSQWIFPL